MGVDRIAGMSSLSLPRSRTRPDGVSLSFSQVAALALHLTAVGIFAPVLRLTSELIADLSETCSSLAFFSSFSSSRDLASISLDVYS